MASSVADISGTDDPVAAAMAILDTACPSGLATTAGSTIPSRDPVIGSLRERIAERGHTSPSEDEIASLVDDLLRRASGDQADTPRATGTRAKTTHRDRRVAAKTTANNSAPTQLPKEAPPDDPEPAPEAAGEVVADAAQADEEEPLAEVIPLGVYDPHEEAQRWW